jgi:hypothetical protein
VQRRAEAAVRESWLDALETPRDAETRVQSLTIAPMRGDAKEIAFCILGDPGEGDSSQYAVVRPFLARDREKRFAFAYVLSDVIYPAGDSTDYPTKFYGPYQRFDRPIYAIPGNHDWDDGSLTGFMTHFTLAKDGARPREAPDGLESTLRSVSRLSLFWRGRVPPSPSERRVGHALEARDLRDEYVRLAAPQYDVAYPRGQPGSYFRIQVGPLALIGIDTGMTGGIDRPQAEWLLNVSKLPEPKVLLTGKPLIVNGHAKTEPDIDWGDDAGSSKPKTVLDIVRNSEHNFIATVGGDIHNYQRYSVDAVGGSKREIACFVAGGSGAFVASTELIGSDEGTKAYTPKALYPTRGLSRVHFEIGVANRLLSSGLLAGISVGTALILALLFLLPRGEDISSRSVRSSIAAIVAIAFVVAITRPRRFHMLRRALWWLALLTMLAIESSYLVLSLRLIFTGLVLLLAVPALWKLYELSHDLGVTTVALVALLVPLGASLVLSQVGAPIEEHRRVYTVGYAAAVIILGLIACSLSRKLSTREGNTIRERRPYSSTVLAGSAWLLLMLILAGSGRLITLHTIAGSWTQVFLLAASGAAVAAAGLVARPGTRWPLLWTVFIALTFVGGGTLGLFYWGWHDTAEQREALRVGLFEGTTAVIAGFLLTAALLSLYAQFRVLRKYRDEGAIQRRIDTAESELQQDRDDGDRHELITTILRLIGRNDWVGPIFESRDPPMLKSFLEATVTEGAVTFAAYRASGFEREADSPVLLDTITLQLQETSRGS